MNNQFHEKGEKEEDVIKLIIVDVRYFRNKFSTTPRYYDYLLYASM